MDSTRRTLTTLVIGAAMLLGLPAAASAQLESPNPLGGGSTFEGGDANAANAFEAQSPSLLADDRTDWASPGGLSVHPLRDPQQDDPLTTDRIEGDSAFTGGDKESEPDQWGYQTHLDSPVTPGKDNLFAAWGIPDIQPGQPAYVYLSFYREKQTGDTYVTFELNQAGEDIRWVNSTLTPVPCRQTGDLLISYEVNPSNDGDDVDLIVYKWTSLGETADLDSSGAPTADPAEVYYRCGKVGDIDQLLPDPQNPDVPVVEAQAAMNFGSAIDNALPLNVDDGVPEPTDTIAQGRFGEAAINLTAIFGAIDDACINFGSWQVHSRSSHSITSQLQDVLGPGPIDVADCEIEVEKTVRRAAEPEEDYGESATLHVGDTAEYKFEVTNPGNRALEITSLTDARGTEVDDDPGDDPCEPVYQSGDADEDGLLAPGDDETWVYTCSYVVQESDGTGFPDTAHVVGRVPGCEGALARCGAEDDDDASITVIDPDIDVTKDVDVTVAHAGDVLTYTILVENTGDTPLSVTLEDLGCTFDEEADLTFDLAKAGDEGDSAEFECSTVMPDEAEYVNEACATGVDSIGDDHSEVDDCDDATTRRVTPAIDVAKSVDKTVAHVGDLLTYTIVVTNEGDIALDVAMSDVEKDTDVAGCEFSEEVPDSFALEPGASREFTCTKAAPDQAEYVNEVCVVGVDALDDEHSTVGACDEVGTKIIKPVIDVTKDVDKTSAGAGETLTYAIVVSNPGDTGLAVSMKDLEKGTAADGCTFPEGTSMTFDLAPKESKQFTCTQPMPDQAAYVNEVCVSGADMIGGPKGTVSDCDDATTTLILEPPGQVVLGERIAPGAARLLGPTGCRGQAFRVRVAGTRVARVVFTLDGKRLRTLTRPNFRNQFAVRIDPRRLRVGVHRLRATVTFERGSNTRPKTMRLTFQRCARALQAPRFTG